MDRKTILEAETLPGKPRKESKGVSSHGDQKTKVNNRPCTCFLVVNMDVDLFLISYTQREESTCEKSRKRNDGGGGTGATVNGGVTIDSADLRNSNSEKGANNKVPHRRGSGSHHNAPNSAGRTSVSSPESVREIHADFLPSSGTAAALTRGVSSAASHTASGGVGGGGTPGSGNGGGTSGAGREDDDDRTSIVSLDSDSTNGPLFWCARALPAAHSRTIDQTPHPERATVCV